VTVEEPNAGHHCPGLADGGLTDISSADRNTGLRPRRLSKAALREMPAGGDQILKLQLG